MAQNIDVQNGILLHFSQIHKHYEDHIFSEQYDTSHFSRNLKDLANPNAIKLIQTISIQFFCERQQAKIMHTIPLDFHMRRYVEEICQVL